jgi:hypothetical protein
MESSEARQTATATPCVDRFREIREFGHLCKLMIPKCRSSGMNSFRSTTACGQSDIEMLPRLDSKELSASTT